MSKFVSWTKTSTVEQAPMKQPHWSFSSSPMVDTPQVHGRAIPVIVKNSNSRYELNVKELELILKNRNVAGKKVVLLSISGAFRKGKSFMMNLFMAYLESLERGKDVKWLDKETPMDKFHYRGGSQPDTNGIVMWNKPYLLKGNKGEEVADYAVFLMDTQGTFDHSSKIKDCASIFAMSTLLSSVQIFNLDKQIQSDDLDNLRLFTEYARLAKSYSAPFQKLLFLIRDWPNSDEFSYGFEGGRNYLRNILEANTGGSNPFKCFEKLEAFLMPHPGKHVANNNSKTKLGDIDEDFGDELLCFIPALFNGNNLLCKKVNGQEITAIELCELFKTYMAVFNSDRLPEPKSILDATIEATDNVAVEAAKEIYEKRMKTYTQLSDLKKLADLQKQAEDDGLKRFETRPKMGDGRGDKKKKDALMNYFQSRYAEFKKIISEKVETEEAKKRAEKAEKELAERPVKYVYIERPSSQSSSSGSQPEPKIIVVQAPSPPRRPSWDWPFPRPFPRPWDGGGCF